jgi:hypothetical protein
VLAQVDAAVVGPFMLGEQLSAEDAVFAPFLDRMHASLLYYKGLDLRCERAAPAPRLRRWFVAYYVAAVGTFVSVTLFETRTFCSARGGLGQEEAGRRGADRVHVAAALGLAGAVRNGHLCFVHARHLLRDVREPALEPHALRARAAQPELRAIPRLAGARLAAPRDDDREAHQDARLTKERRLNKAARALGFIEDAAKEKRKAALVVSIAYIAFCIVPPLLSQQSKV